MSLLVQGIKGLGNIVYYTGNTIWQGGKGIAHAVCTAPVAIKNSTIQAATFIKNTTSSAVNVTVNKAKSMAKGLGSGAVRLLSAGKDAVIARAVQNHAELFFRILSLGNKIVNDLSIEVSQVNRNELAERLEEFVENLSPKEQAFVVGFCKDLRNAAIPFDKAKLDEMTFLDKILQPHYSQHMAYISAKKAERDQLEKLPGLTTSPSPKLTSVETLSGIQAQVELLKSNSIKMILGSIILNVTLGMSTFEGIDFNALQIPCQTLGIAPPDSSTNLINFLIEVSNKAVIKGKSSEEVFQDLMYRVINHSGKNIFIRIYAKVCCSFIFAVVLNLVGNLFDNLKATLDHFARLPPAKQLEELTQLLINPLLGQLSAVDGSEVANQPAANIPKTADEFLDQFIEVFLAQFIDKKYQPWTQIARSFCNEKAAHSDLMAKVFYTTLSVMLWIAGKCTAPIHWVINETIHGILKSVIVDLCPRLSDATKKSLEIGTDNAWYSLKNNLLRLLQQVRLTSLLPRAEDPIYRPPKELPEDVKEKLTTALDKLFKVLAVPDQTQTAPQSNPTITTVYCALTRMFCEEDLTNLFATADGKALITLLQQNMHGNLGSLKDIIKTALTELILDLVTEDDFLNGTLLSSLTSINESGFTSKRAPIVSTEEKQRVEVELQKELGLLGGNILQAVNESTRADRSSQTAANIHITALKQHVTAFNQTLLEDLPSKNSVLEACAQFNKSMEKLEADMTKSVDAPTKALLMPHLNQALDHVRTIGDNLNQCSIEEKRKQVEAKLNELYPLMANQDEINKVIEELRALDASFLDVEGLAQELKEYHQIYQRRLASLAGQRGSSSAYTKPFRSLVADYKDRANTAAQAQMKQHLTNTNATIKSAAQFTQWANELQFVKVTTKPTATDLGMTAVYNLPLVKAVTSNALQAYGRNIFAFIGDEKNLAGIAQRGMEAYLNKPAMLPKKERPKVGIFALLSDKTT